MSKELFRPKSICEEKNMKRNRFFMGSTLLLCGALIFTSCDNFFSTSWGTKREYDSSRIVINAGNIDEWIEAADGNPALAAAITDKIKQELSGAGSNGGQLTPDQAKLQQVGIDMAIEASGIGTAIITSAADIVSNLQNLNTSDADGLKNTMTDLLNNVVNTFKEVNGSGAAHNLAEVVNVSLTDDVSDYLFTTDNPSDMNNLTYPEFSDQFAANAKAGDVGQAVMVLALAVIDDKINEVLTTGTLNDNLTEYGIVIDNTVSPAKAAATTNSTPESVALAAYLSLIAADTSGKYSGNPITNAIQSAFGMTQSGN
jgi:hypothetical protein